MKILITGAAGFIGSNLSEFLIKNGHTVIGLDNFNDAYDPKWKVLNISELSEDPSFKLYRTDITDEPALNEVFENEKPEAVVHLAAWTDLTLSVQKPDVYAHVNYCGTDNLAHLASLHKSGPFIFASTGSIYGSKNQPPYKEELDTSYTLAPYPASKKAGEVLLYSYHINWDLHVCNLRFFNPTGPRMNPSLAMPKLIKAAVNGTRFALYQNPDTSCRDYFYIGDVCEAIENAIKANLEYEIINIGNSVPTKLREFIDTVKKVTGKEIDLYEDFKSGQMAMTYADITKAKDLLGYNPKTTMEMMVQSYYDWFMKQPDWYRT